MQGIMPIIPRPSGPTRIFSRITSRLFADQTNPEMPLTVNLDGEWNTKNGYHDGAGLYPDASLQKPRPLPTQSEYPRGRPLTRRDFWDYNPIGVISTFTLPTERLLPTPERCQTFPPSGGTDTSATGDRYPRLL